MLKMKESGAELVLDFHESFELVFRPMSKIDYKPTIAGNWGLSSLKVLDIVGAKEIEGTVMGQALDLSLDAPKAFVARMEKEYGKEFRWPVVAALGYDAAQVRSKRSTPPNRWTRKRCAMRWRLLTVSRRSRRRRPNLTDRRITNASTGSTFSSAFGRMGPSFV